MTPPLHSGARLGPALQTELSHLIMLLTKQLFGLVMRAIYEPLCSIRHNVQHSEYLTRYNLKTSTSF